MSAPPELEARTLARDQEAENRLLEAAVFRSVLRWFSGGAALGSALLMMQALRAPPVSTGVATISLMVGLIPAFLLLQRPLGYPRTAVLFLGYVLMACTYIQCERGLTPGVALAMVTFLLLSGLFFGMRGARWAFVASLGSLVASALVSVNPLASRWEREFWDPHNPIVWLRYAAVLFFFGGSLLSAFTKLSAGYIQIGVKLRATLERERSERKQRERAEQALEQAQRLEALAQYAGGLAHDFNNSLMVIVGGTALIADDDQADERIRAIARDIGKSAESGTEMVRHLLQLGRRTPPERERVSAETIVQQCRGTLRAVLPETIKLEVEVDKTAELMIDVAGIQQALLNLALNARDAMAEPGTFVLRVTRSVITEPPKAPGARAGTFVVLSCEDTGSGMDEATRARLFEPFFTTKAAGKGTGLGLATVQRFVREAGGFIVVDSQLGVGTAFHLHFPAPEESAPSESAAKSPAELRPTDTL
jgi:signal transduction histidine kinase